MFRRKARCPSRQKLMASSSDFTVLVPWNPIEFSESGKCYSTLPGFFPGVEPGNPAVRDYWVASGNAAMVEL